MTASEPVLRNSSEFEARLLLTEMSGPRKAAVEYVTEDLGKGEQFAQADRDIVMYLSFRRLIKESMDFRTSRNTKEENAELLVKWANTLAGVIKLEGGVEQARRYQPLIGALCDGIESRGILARLTFVFTHIGNTEQNPERFLALTLLNEVENRLKLFKVEQVEWPSIPVPSNSRQWLEDLGEKLLACYGRERGAALKFVREELCGAKLGLEQFDRESVFYFAFKHLAQATEEDFKAGRTEALNKRVVQWEEGLRLMQILSKNPRLLKNSASPFLQALEVVRAEQKNDLPGFVAAYLRLKDPVSRALCQGMHDLLNDPEEGREGTPKGPALGQDSVRQNGGA
jgi:hypothetical protein